ncbi:hypothetical protein MRX96_030933 [Rhipicephalus microplus]
MARGAAHSPGRRPVGVVGQDQSSGSKAAQQSGHAAAPAGIMAFASLLGRHTGASTTRGVALSGPVEDGLALASESSSGG